MKHKQNRRLLLPPFSSIYLILYFLILFGGLSIVPVPARSAECTVNHAWTDPSGKDFQSFATMPKIGDKYQIKGRFEGCVGYGADPQAKIELLFIPPAGVSQAQRTIVAQAAITQPDQFIVKSTIFNKAGEYSFIIYFNDKKIYSAVATVTPKQKPDQKPAGNKNANTQPEPPSNDNVNAPPAGDASDSNTLFNPIKYQTLGDLIISLTKLFVTILSIVAVAFIVLGGGQLVISAGNQEAIEKGKKTITWAIIGLVFALLAFSIVAIIEDLIGTTF